MSASRSDSVSLAGFIDLHAHTNESDGTLPPEELIALAAASKLDALAITDHDTIEGYSKARVCARDAGVDLICGIELNSRLYFPPGDDYRSVHLLGYFPNDAPSAAFTERLHRAHEDRRIRNGKLIEVLRKLGLEITLQEVEARGRSLTGRPHFARVLVEKGYASSFEDAFTRYIGESAPSFVERQSQTTEEAIQTIREGGGIPSLAHPVRLSLPREAERAVIIRLKDAGLMALEAWHSEHSPELQAHYKSLAKDLELLVTGGSDFHGGPKPGVKLGTGLKDNIRVPRSVLENMRQLRSTPS